MQTLEQVYNKLQTHFQINIRKVLTKYKDSFVSGSSLLWALEPNEWVPGDMDIYVPDNENPGLFELMDDQGYEYLYDCDHTNYNDKYIVHTFSKGDKKVQFVFYDKRDYLKSDLKGTDCKLYPYSMDSTYTGDKKLLFQNIQLTKYERLLKYKSRGYTIQYYKNDLPFIEDEKILEFIEENGEWIKGTCTICWVNTFNDLQCNHFVCRSCINDFKQNNDIPQDEYFCPMRCHKQ